MVEDLRDIIDHLNTHSGCQDTNDPVSSHPENGRTTSLNQGTISQMLIRALKPNVMP